MATIGGATPGNFLPIEEREDDWKRLFFDFGARTGASPCTCSIVSAFIRVT